MAKDDGGQMFPVGAVFNENLLLGGGISLRTWLAAKEYVALLRNAGYTAAQLANEAFDRADIFIAEMRRREKET